MNISRIKMGIVLGLLISGLLVGGAAFADGDTTLTYWAMWEKGELHQQVLEQAIAEFEKDYDVKIDVRWTGRDVVTAAKPRILAGEDIDLIDQSAEELYGGIVKAGIAEDLSGVLDMKIPGEDNTVRDVLKEISYDAYLREDGSLYMIPYNFISSAFWYNENLFKDLGIEAPDTWQEFLEISKVLKDNGIAPVSISLNEYAAYYPAMVAARVIGPRALNKAAGDKTGDSFRTENWERVGEILYAFSDKGEDLFIDNYKSIKWPSEQMNWAMGRAGMFYCGSWIHKETSKAAGENFEYASFQFPKVEGGEGNPKAVEAYPIGFSVFKESDNKELAKKFITYFLKEKWAENFVDHTKGMTARKGIPTSKPLQDIQESINNATDYFRYYGGVYGDYPDWFSKVHLPMTKKVLSGKVTGAEWAEQMATKTAEFWEKQ